MPTPPTFSPHTRNAVRCVCVRACGVHLNDRTRVTDEDPKSHRVHHVPHHHPAPPAPPPHTQHKHTVTVAQDSTHTHTHTHCSYHRYLPPPPTTPLAPSGGVASTLSPDGRECGGGGDSTADSPREGEGGPSACTCACTGLTRDKLAPWAAAVAEGGRTLAGVAAVRASTLTEGDLLVKPARCQLGLVRSPARSPWPGVAPLADGELCALRARRWSMMACIRSPWVCDRARDRYGCWSASAALMRSWTPQQRSLCSSSSPSGHK